MAPEVNDDTAAQQNRARVAVPADNAAPNAADPTSQPSERAVPAAPIDAPGSSDRAVAQATLQTARNAVLPTSRAAADPQAASAAPLLATAIKLTVDPALDALRPAGRVVTAPEALVADQAPSRSGRAVEAVSPQNAGGNASQTPSDGHPSSGYAATAAATRQTTVQAARTDPTALAPQDRVHVVEQVAQKLETMRLTHGRQEATIRLQPEHLGSVQLTVVTDRSSVNARIVVESGLVRHAVEEGKAQLHTALEQKGFSLQGLDVALNQSGGGQQFTPQPRSGDLIPIRTEQPINAASAAEPESTLRSNQPIGIKDGRLDTTA